MCNVVNAYYLAVQKYKELSVQDIELRTGAVFDRERQVLVMNYFGREYIIDGEGTVTCGEEQADYNNRTIIMQYLCECSGLPPRGRWISFLELPGGEHHYVPFQKDGTIPLARKFGGDPGSFCRAARSLGGKEIDVGDAGFEIPALPKLPLAVILWEGDEEFAAQSNVLFDSVSPNHLSTATLWVLGIELVTKMLARVDGAAAGEQAVKWLGK